MAVEQERKKVDLSATVQVRLNELSKDFTNFQTAQFFWFIGQLVTLIGISIYSFAFIGIFKNLRFFAYNLSFIGILSTFLILTFQSVTKKGITAQLLKSDDFHYLILSAIFLITRPYILLPLIPFGIYSVFHVLAYINGHILPTLSFNTDQLSKFLTTFIQNHNVKSVQIGSAIELYSFIWLFIRVITFRKRSLTPFIIYAIFIKTRYEKNIFTRNYVKSFEVQIDKIVNQSNVPVLKNIWTQFKSIIRRIGGIYLVNNYTKEKSTQ